MTSITSIIDAPELVRHFDAQEISTICTQVCDHILEIIGSQYSNISIQRITLNKLNSAIQLRLGVLGRIATRVIKDDPRLVVREITLTTSIIKEDDDVVMVNYEHGLTKTTFGLLSPDLMLDFLLVLLEEGVKGIKETLPKRTRYNRYIKECVTAVRDTISELRPIARIPYLPGYNSNMALASLSVKVDVNQSSDIQ